MTSSNRYSTRPEMNPHVSLRDETLFTKCTVMHFLTGMSFDMVSVRSVVRELFPAKSTHVRFFSGMNAQMRRQYISGRKRPGTNIASEWFFARVRTKMLDELAFAR